MGWGGREEVDLGREGEWGNGEGGRIEGGGNEKEQPIPIAKIIRALPFF